jgi:CHAT domain-containing protein
MARQSTQLLRAIQAFILALLGLLMSLGIAQGTPTTPEQLIHRGFSQFNAGQFAEARQTWHQAEQRYRQQGDRIGQSGALINQSLAYQALGHHRPACYSAAQAIGIDSEICQPDRPIAQLALKGDRAIVALGMKTLADSLTGLGNWDAAETILKQALSEDNRAELWQSLGRLYASSGRKPDAITAYQTALQLAQQSQATENRINAQVELLGLIPPTATAIAQIDLSSLPGILKAQAQLKIARYSDQAQPQIALAQAQAALKLGRQERHIRTEAEALLLIGKIQSKLGQFNFESLKKSVALAQSIRAWDLAYLGQVELAQYWRDRGDTVRAKADYQAALQGIEQVQRQLKGYALAIQSDFAAQVKPIYQNYLELLFADQNRTADIIQTSTALQVAELENFLGCQLEDWQPLSTLQQIDAATLVYVVRGTRHYRVIIRTFGQPDYAYSIDTPTLEASVYNLAVNVQTDTLGQLPATTIAAYGKRLYEVLLKPAVGHLPDRGTITFILDSTLQNIPLDFLHDGQQYLIEQYGLSLALGAQMRQPQVMGRDDFRVLLAGVSQVAPSFGANTAQLVGVESEFEQIATMLPSKTLLNQDFSIEKLRRILNADYYPIIHLASHGKFSSNPKETGILAWDQPLDLFTLRQLVDEQAKRQRSIELLVLSACETAKGDQRSILGLAGVAAQAGARSTIASFWLVNDESTTALMDEFYFGLSQGLSKAEALRQAKLSLIQTPEFSHPFYWGSFQLIGSWL